MSPNKRKIVLDELSSDEDDSPKHRRSSLRVNLSYSTKLSDSGNGSLGRTMRVENNERETDKLRDHRSLRDRSAIEKTSRKVDNDNGARVADNTSKCTVSDGTATSFWMKKGIKLKPLTIDLEDISAKEQALDTDCKRLKDAILSKTKEMFDKQDELSIKTAMVLAIEENNSANNVHNSNADRYSALIPDADRHLESKRATACDRYNDATGEARHSNIFATPINRGGRSSEKVMDRSKVTPKRLFAEEGKPGCRIIEDVILKRNLSISLRQIGQEGSPILSGNNRRLQLLRARSKLSLQSQSKNHNDTCSTVCSNIGPPIVCSTFIESNAINEKGNPSPSHEKNSDVDASLATRTTNKTVSMEITEIQGGFIQSSEKRTSLRDKNPGTYSDTKSKKEGEIKSMSSERSERIISARRLKNIPANKLTVQNDDVSSDVRNIASNEASRRARTSVKEIVLVAEMRDVSRGTRERGNRFDGQSNRRCTLSLSDSSNATCRTSLNVNTSLDAVTENDRAKNARRSDRGIAVRAERDSDAFNNEESLASYERRESSNTNRTSLRVNTSVDSLCKTRRRSIRFGKESLGEDNAEDLIADCSSADDRYSAAREADDTDPLENISLIERLRNISTRNRFSRSDVAKMSETGDKVRAEGIVEPKNATNDKRRKGERENNNSGDNYSYVEGTPYPVSRSVLFRSQLKHRTQNLNDDAASGSDNASSTNSDEGNDKAKPDAPQSTLISSETCTSAKTSKLVDGDTVILEDTLNCNSSLTQKKLIVIDDTHTPLDKIELETNQRSTIVSQNTKCIPIKRGRRRLLSLNDNSPCSITPLDEDSSASENSTPIKKNNKKPGKKPPQKKLTSFKNGERSAKYNIAKERRCSDDDYDISSIKRKEEKKTRRPKKIISKKIVIKKFADEHVLKLLKENAQTKEEDRSVEARDSLDDFVAHKKMIPTQWNKHKSQKIIIVTTGLSKGDKSLVRTIVKSLGVAEVELNVSRRTTHVVSTGVRTVNLLRGIIRGCWLVTLEWVLKSLENNAWLNPEEFEMKHFSKAVLENRKDRQLFGPSYVPELFTACGLIHVELKTTLPHGTLKELIKTAGGHITENPKFAKITIGANGVKETWIIDSITTGELQSTEFYRRK